MARRGAVPGGAPGLLPAAGLRHGFQTLTPDCELLYLHTEFYSPEHEGGLRFDDPALAIPWPLPVADISGRDRSHPLLAEGFAPLET
jgi:dTDP-4-dehydrorhamnose 3,5-epimerase